MFGSIGFLYRPSVLVALRATMTASVLVAPGRFSLFVSELDTNLDHALTGFVLKATKEDHK